LSATLLHAGAGERRTTRRQRFSHCGTTPVPLPQPHVLKPGFHCARTHWIRGFMAFELARRTWIVMLMVPV
jgi:hypothetical protein